MSAKMLSLADIPTSGKVDGCLQTEHARWVVGPHVRNVVQDQPTRHAERVIGGERVALVQGSRMQGDFSVRLWRKLAVSGVRATLPPNPRTADGFGPFLGTV